jgi:hypothetical protein
MFNGLNTGLHWGLFVLQSEQSWYAFPMGGDAFELGVFIKLSPAVKELVGYGMSKNPVSV